MNVQLNDSGIPIMKEKTLAQKVKGVILWVILIMLTIAAGLLVYLCFVGASEMAALTSFRQISDHPYATMTYENYDYSQMLNEELPDNNAVIKHFKKKFFKSLYRIMPGENSNPYTPKGSVAFYSQTQNYTHIKGRIYNTYDTPLMMVISNPATGYKSWNIVDMSDLGVESELKIDQWYSNAMQTVAAAYCTSEGINQEGLSVSLLTSPVADCKDTPLVNITPFMAVRLMLDQATTVDNAIEILKRYDIDFSYGTYHFFISEKEGKSAIVEYINGSMEIHAMPQKAVYQVCSNKMESDKIPAAARDYNDAYSELTLYDYFDKSINEVIGGGSAGVDGGYMQTLMEKKSVDETEGDDEYNGTRLYGTQYSLLYDFERSKMYIVIGNDKKSQSYSYDLSR